ncbi:MAG TPA: hypothetical protein VMU92_01325 [Acidobacteriaceae bacterium]|nr:hypothetical protein [Acidobacteriaceae bacterium]
MTLKSYSIGKGLLDLACFPFPPFTGGCTYAGVIQQKILKSPFERICVLGVGLGRHVFRHTCRSLLDETGAPVGMQQRLMRQSNVATTMNVCGEATLRAMQKANSKVIQMVINREASNAESQATAG